MKFSVAQRAILVAAFGIAAAAPAQAMSEREEIQALLARVKKLEAKVAAEEKKPKTRETLFVKGSEPPVAEDKIVYKGLTITPGGYIDLSFVRRSNWLGSDMSTPWSKIPYGFNPWGHTDEFRFSARASRQSLKVQGDFDPLTHITGYGETDFQGAAQTANSNQTNSYNLRIRQMYMNIDRDDWALHFAAGQMWSLSTANSVGIKPDTSLQPMVIDQQYLPGYWYARQPGIRVTKDFNKEFWIAFSAESPATTWDAPQALPCGAATSVLATSGLPGVSCFGGTPLARVTTPWALWPAGYAGPFLTGTPTSGFNTANQYSFNSMPDITGKVAWDATWLPDRKLHIEGWGIVREFTDRSLWGNQNVWGGGGGGSVVVEAMPKLLDLWGQVAVGRGIGRYGAAGLSDATVAISGAPLPITERMFLLGAILHPTDVTDVYGYAGGEFQNKNPQYYGAPGPAPARLPWLVVAGEGNPFYSNLGCNVENAFANNGASFGAATAPIGGAACSGHIKDVKQATGGIWHTFYQGPAGKLRVGFQYSYTKKDGYWSYLGGAPSAHESQVEGSIRWFPFN